MVEEPETKPRFNESEMRMLTSILLERQLFMRQAGFQFDGRRNLYDIFGYDRIITSQQYRDEYARGGIAKQIVDTFPKATWREGVDLREDEDPDVSTPFEEAWDALEKKLGIWNKLQSADILAGQSTYSAILLGAPGNLDEELPKGSKLLYLQPFFGGGGPGNHSQSPSSRLQSTNEDVTIETFDVDPSSERFGEPLTYRIRRTDLASPMLARPVHWSRVIHICEGALDNNVYGVPTLEAVWNLLMDLEKITGGGAESSFQRAKHTLTVNAEKDVSFDPAAVTALKDKLEEYMHGITNIIPTRGTEVKLLEATTSQFGPNADAILKQIAGATGIPMRILTGSEMGTLASEQDAANFSTRVKDRRTGYAGPMIVRKLVDRLIDYGYLPTPESYEVWWPEEEEDQNALADFAVKLATINKTQGEVVITNDEIRDMSFGMEPLSEEEKVSAATKMQQDQMAQAAETAKAQAKAQAAAPQPNPNAPPGKPAPGTPAPVAKPVAAQVRELEAAIERNDLAAIGRLLDLGDVEGHDFHGNQWTAGSGDGKFGGHEAIVKNLLAPIRARTKYRTAEALTPQSVIDMLADGQGTDALIMAKNYVASLGDRLSSISDEDLFIEFEAWRKQYGMGFDGKRDA